MRVMYMNFKTVFPKGERAASPYFIGTVWIATLVPRDDILNCQISHVTFEPGARNNWHIHPGGQILLVTGGRGLYQEYGQPPRVIREGDVIIAKPGVKHWHGAAPDSWLSHISIITNLQRGDVIWLEPVTDEYYFNIARMIRVEG